MAENDSRRVFEPPLDVVLNDRLRTKLNDGEKAVFDFFRRHLPVQWEIYTQPHLNGLRPDFVLLNPKVGIAVFEVKDWDLDALDYVVKTDGGPPILWASERGGPPFRLESPIEKVVRYKNEIMNLYCPHLGTLLGNSLPAMAVVTAGVIVTSEETDHVRDHYRPFLEHFNLVGSKEQYYPVAGKDLLAKGRVNDVFPNAAWQSSKFMSPEIAADLRTWLQEPEHSAQQREPLQLSTEQQEIAATRTSTGYRRIRGAAGCG